MMASRAIETGDAEMVVASGVESKARAPWVLPKPSRTFQSANTPAVSTTLGSRPVNDRMPREWTISLGECNERLQARPATSSQRRDEFAADSHALATAACEFGFYDSWTIPVDDTDLVRDESIRPSTTAEKLAGLEPAFRPDRSITAGNASPISDGASALLLGSEAAANAKGTDPLARVVGRGVHALDPQDFGFAPVEAANSALARAGISWSDVAAVELHEAFAVQSLACVDSWKIDPDIVNSKGGSIAIGHPLGASGTRVLGTLTPRLAESGDRPGVAAIYIGVGQSLAVVLENAQSTR